MPTSGKHLIIFKWMLSSNYYYKAKLFINLHSSFYLNHLKIFYFSWQSSEISDWKFCRAVGKQSATTSWKQLTGIGDKHSALHIWTKYFFQILFNFYQLLLQFWNVWLTCRFKHLWPLVCALLSDYSDLLPHLHENKKLPFIWSFCMRKINLYWQSMWNSQQMLAVDVVGNFYLTKRMFWGFCYWNESNS